MRVIALLMSCLLAACASPREPKPAEESPDVICFSEAAIGTNFKTRRCMSREAYEKSGDKTRRGLDEIPGTSPNVR